MADPKPLHAEPEHQSTGTMLFRVGVALLVVFVILMLAAVFPLKIIDPGWQLRVIRSLVNNGTIAVLGLVLISLAPVIFPSEKLKQRRLKIANFAVVASIGYLLILPLQGVAIWQGLSTFNNSQSRQIQTAKEKIEQIRKAVNQSSNTADLQKRLQALPGPGLPPLNTNAPIEVVRPQLLSMLDTAQGQLKQRSAGSGLTSERLQQVIQESIRVGLSALVFAAAFACGAVWPGGSRPLLDSWLIGFSKLFGWLRPRRRRQGKKSANQEYFEQISGAGPRDPGES
ncbi:MAG: HpsJ family protein [Synechococcaceae cyanobacterium]|jgi:hypothetical protein